MQRTRRYVLSAGAAITAGAVALPHMTTPTQAAVSGLDIPDAELTTTDGEVTGIWITASAEWQYKTDAVRLRVVRASFPDGVG